MPEKVFEFLNVVVLKKGFCDQVNKKLLLFEYYYVSYFVCPFQTGKKLKAAKAEVQEAKDEKDTINTESQQLTKEKARLDYIIKDLSDEVQGDDKSKVRCPIRYLVSCILGSKTGGAGKYLILSGFTRKMKCEVLLECAVTSGGTKSESLINYRMTAKDMRLVW